MGRLGHASPQAAMVYQHAAADRDRLIAAGLDAMATEAGLAPVVELKRRDDPAPGSEPANGSA
jgi:hypothetical protein